LVEQVFDFQKQKCSTWMCDLSVTQVAKKAWLSLSSARQRASIVKSWIT